MSPVIWQSVVPWDDQPETLAICRRDALQHINHTLRLAVACGSELARQLGSTRLVHGIVASAEFNERAGCLVIQLSDPEQVCPWEKSDTVCRSSDGSVVGRVTKIDRGEGVLYVETSETSLPTGTQLVVGSLVDMSLSNGVIARLGWHKTERAYRVEFETDASDQPESLGPVSRVTESDVIPKEMTLTSKFNRWAVLCEELERGLGVEAFEAVHQELTLQRAAQRAEEGLR